MQDLLSLLKLFFSDLSRFVHCQRKVVGSSEFTSKARLNDVAIQCANHLTDEADKKRIKKSMHISFPLHCGNFSSVIPNQVPIPESSTV